MEDLKNARFLEADFSGARFHSVIFSKVTMSNAFLFDVDISGRVANLSVNGIDVSEYVERELNRLHPERALLAASDPDGMRKAWNAIVELADATLARARALPPDQLDESVNEEWSYLETLRHLVFATDRWITGPVLGEAIPFHPLGMPNPPHDETVARWFSLDATPTLDEVLAVRRDRMRKVTSLVEGITSDELAREVASPNGGTTTVMSCLHIVFDDAWWHDQYANRDLAILERG